MNPFRKIQDAVLSALYPAMKTSLWILKITVPVSFGVLLLKMTGLLPVIARVFEPVFSLLDMPGEAALVFVTACLVNIYACIAVIETLDLSAHAVTILALMCLIAHNLPVESAVQQKTGTPFWRMLCIRLGCSIAGAFALFWLLPQQAPSGAAVASPVLGWAMGDIGSLFREWLFTISWLCVKILVLITVLMILQRILESYGVIQRLSKVLKYPLMVVGVPHQAAFLWIVANTLGLAYGAGVIIDHVDQGHLSPYHADLLNHHIAVSHSLLEDTLLFVAIGVSAVWITFPRLALAAGVVWLKRLWDHTKARGASNTKQG